LSDAAAMPADQHGHPPSHGFGEAGAHAHHPAQQHHFDTLEQQHEASTLGMWLFLITEVMFFGGLFMAYTLYRIWYPEAWAEGSRELDIRLGGFNTVVLIASSLTMAFAVRTAQTGYRRANIGWLLATMVLGLTFLVVKFFEYKEKFELHHVPGYDFHITGPHANLAGPMEIFFSLYFTMTGLHALHMLIGFGILSVITWMSYKNRFSPEWYTPVEMSGLYWHFVDIVWIFLFPLLYLVDRAHHFA
jgi:cytochrome c oxidase subunit III